jgi:hypothetical protein
MLYHVCIHILPRAKTPPKPRHNHHLAGVPKYPAKTPPWGTMWGICGGDKKFWHMPELELAPHFIKREKGGGCVRRAAINPLRWRVGVRPGGGKGGGGVPGPVAAGSAGSARTERGALHNPSRNTLFHTTRYATGYAERIGLSAGRTPAQSRVRRITRAQPRSNADHASRNPAESGYT